METASSGDDWFRSRLSVPVECLVVVLVAVVHLGSTAFVWYALELGLFDAVVIAVPSLGMLVFMGVLLIGPIHAEIWRQVSVWTIGGIGVLGGFLVGALLIQNQLSLASTPLVLFITGIGGVGGLLIGYSRGNSIAAERRANELEAQQDRLLFLNQLLRHNVLNNIAIIKGHADLIAEDHDLTEPRFETIQQRSAAVTKLIENVRLLVRVFQEQPARRAMELSTPLHEEVEGLRQTYPDVEIESSLPADVTIVADPLLRYVFENVLHNAVEHNDADSPRVEIAVERDDYQVVVTITDNGPGIPESIIEEIETEAYDVSHGVGLYLVSVLMQRYDGDLDISTATPRGTRVTLTFQTPGS